MNLKQYNLHWIQLETLSDIDNMGFCSKGIDKRTEPTRLSVEVHQNQPLIQLSNIIPWERLSYIVFPDLKRSTGKQKWWLGRKLKLRIHLAVFLLQQLLNETD